MRLTRAETDEQVERARELFKEYEAATGVDLCFQNFGQELATLPGDYALPTGRLIIAFDGEEAAGCVALRKVDDAVCEMKLHVAVRSRPGSTQTADTSTVVYQTRD